MLPILILALTAAAVQPAPPATAPSGHTLQEDFDAATAASNDGRCGEAIEQFEALEMDGRVQPGTLPAAAIAIRKGKCLVALGHFDEGEASILAGLPTIAAAGESFSGDVYESQMSLGLVATQRYDFDAARHHYESALALTEGMGRLPALIALAKVTSFDGTDTPLAYAEEGMRIIDGQPVPDKNLRASFMTVHARALLNQGRTEPAYDELKDALEFTGGLTQKVTLSQAATRGDLAIAALLQGKPDDAARYLAYTGAGRIAESPFIKAEDMDVPVCGNQTGLRPEDEAVVEFSIDQDGSVDIAQTVYTRGGPKVAAAFASAVSQWYWDPERLSKIPPFFLAATRVELRCTRAGSDAPGIMAPLKERFAAWATGPLAPLELSENPNTIVRLRQILAEPDIANAPARFVAAAGMLNLLDPRWDEASSKQLDDALAAAQAASLPAEATNALRVSRALAHPALVDKSFKTKRDMPGYVESLFDLASSPNLADDALAADTLRLLGAQQARWLKDREQVAAEVRLVADDARLPEHHPLRQVAELRLADYAAVAHDLETAQAHFERTGLSEEQCSLLGVKPAMHDPHVSSRDYPVRALQMGFEGWTRVEFDIDADGKTAGGRTVIAYPPFVFSDGAEAMSHDFVYESSYRPNGELACSAQREEISFEIPHPR